MGQICTSLRVTFVTILYQMKNNKNRNIIKFFCIRIFFSFWYVQMREKTGYESKFQEELHWLCIHSILCQWEFLWVKPSWGGTLVGNSVILYHSGSESCSLSLFPGSWAGIPGSFITWSPVATLCGIWSTTVHSCSSERGSGSWQRFILMRFVFV